MTKIKIVTDSTADLTVDLIERYQIEVLPLTVTLNEVSYRDGVDITRDAFYQLMSTTEEFPTTSQIPPAVFAEAYQRLAAEGVEHIISIHISGDLSGTYQSSVLAGTMVENTVHVHCIDSKSATIGLGPIVLAAARLAEQNLPIAEILETLNRVVEQTAVYFLLDSLDNLHKGGRIGKASHMVGSLLNLKPILSLNEGVISAYEKIRGNKGNKALERLIDILAEKIDPNKKLYCAIGYSDSNALEQAKYIQERLQDKVDCDEFVYLQIGSVVGAHIGTGAVGMGFYQL